VRGSALTGTVRGSALTGTARGSSLTLHSPRRRLAGIQPRL